MQSSLNAQPLIPGAHNNKMLVQYEGDTVISAQCHWKMGSAMCKIQICMKRELFRGGSGENDAYATIKSKCVGPNQ